ncbi:hypothetical protein BLA18628_07182 [Burkholderia aenigmatica]|uniref:hypothetical protein n=1 Tax=Burkholderia aenigmatica TaxID=2015348 RepID=UPI0014545858|nr:hypothetical protein [Burkholderia aenigmatica]VWD60770.1 hypothetical protein BLA18628_07182 [Burkholderia aenigmatica]
MLHPHPITPRALPSHVDSYADRVQAEADARAEAEQASFDRASAEVEIDDVINAMAELPAGFRAKVMNAFLDKSDRAYFAYLLGIMFEDAFNAAAEGIAKRKGY